MSDQPPELQKVRRSHVHIQKPLSQRDFTRIERIRREIQLFVVFLIGFAIGLAIFAVYSSHLSSL